MHLYKLGLESARRSSQVLLRTDTTVMGFHLL
jgi:hypothetical protein